MGNYWGYHLMLDCSECDTAQMTDKENIKNFVKDLVIAIDMIAVGEPWIERTAIGMPDKEGYSMYQLITTSNISGHFIDQARHIYLDVFSCKKFDNNTVMSNVKQYFSAQKINTNFVVRNAED
jgi:S-adenosylmethionine/arginine decarboxylase-like enzyme